jgi:hypothetical protein
MKMKLVISKTTVTQLGTDVTNIMKQTNRAVGGGKLDVDGFNPMVFNKANLANISASEDETDFTIEINDKVLFALVTLYAKIFGIINPLISAMIVGFTGLRGLFKDVEEVMSEQAVKEEKEEHKAAYSVRITIPVETPSYIANPFDHTQVVYRTETWVCQSISGDLATLQTVMLFEEDGDGHEIRWLKETVEKHHGGQVNSIVKI